MDIELDDLTINVAPIDYNDVLSCWKWLTGDIKRIILVSVIGDLFLELEDGSVKWLNAGEGTFTKVANSVAQFQLLLQNDDNIDNWFLPLLVEKLITGGKVLKEGEIYSFRKPPVLGGEYSFDNFEQTSISVHFAFSGQICEQIKDLPDGTPVKINFSK